MVLSVLYFNFIILGVYSTALISSRAFLIPSVISTSKHAGIVPAGCWVRLVFLGARVSILVVCVSISTALAKSRRKSIRVAVVGRGDNCLLLASVLQTTKCHRPSVVRSDQYAGHPFSHFTDDFDAV